MSSVPEPQLDDLSGFSGLAPLFPLPNVVLYPHLSLPLHIFEPRYRKMIQDVLEGDRLLAMSLLKPGWETNYEGTPEIHDMVCLAKVIADERLPSGRFNLVVRGVHRAVVTEEVKTDLPYRIARLELYRDFYAGQSPIRRDERQRELLLAARKLFPQSQIDPLFAQLLDSEIPLGCLSDILANALPLTHDVKQEVLEELDADIRSEILLEHVQAAVMEQESEAQRFMYPVRFSLN